MSDLNPDEMIKALQGLVSDLGDETIERLVEFKGAYAAGLALYQREAARQAERLPEDHPRRRRLQAHVEQGPVMIAELAFELEARQVSLRNAPPGVIVVAGRATDERRLGVGGLVVTVEDEDGARIRGIDRVMTDENGSFMVQIPPALADKLAQTEDTRAFVTVRTAKGQTVVHREETPLDFGAQAGRTVNVSVRRRDFGPVPPVTPAAPAPPAAPRGEHRRPMPASGPAAGRGRVARARADLAEGNALDRLSRTDFAQGSRIHPARSLSQAHQGRPRLWVVEGSMHDYGATG